MPARLGSMRGRALITLLFLNALFNVVAWPRFYGRVAKDPRAHDAAGRPTRLIVHAVLIGVALLLAAASAVAAIVALVVGV